jgi:hypothetical protein
MYSKCRPSVGSSERRQQNTIYESDTTNLTVSQADLMDVLGIGAEHAVTSKELLALTGITNTRELRRRVSEARASGAVILSGPTGYYLPNDGEKGQHEAAEFLKMIESKAVSTFRAGEPARLFLRNILPGQISLSTYPERGELQ